MDPSVALLGIAAVGAVAGVLAASVALYAALEAAVAAQLHRWRLARPS
jgi:hypothetical protein